MSDASTRTVAGFTAWAATYDKTIAEEVEKYSGMSYTEVLRRVCEAARVAPGDRVLDIGTGTGALALALAQHLPEGLVTGIDPTAEMLRQAEKNAKSVGLAERVEFRCCQAEALPFSDASFDVVVSSIAMHHTTVPKSLQEIVRVLKPGGRLAIADMASNSKWESTFGGLVVPLLALYYLITKRSWTMMRAELAAYKQLYEKDEWEAMLQQAGLVSIAVQAFPHPTSEWFSGILIIQASKERNP